MTLHSATSRRPVEAQTASTVLTNAIHGPKRPARVAKFATEFQPLDDVLGGGFHAQELVLVGGRPGVGKTIAALQWARSFAKRDITSVFVCYEHSPEVLLGRLLALELGSIVREDELPMLDGLRAMAQEVALGAGNVQQLMTHPLGEEAVGRVRSYGDRLQLIPASGRDTGLSEIEAFVRDGRNGPTAVFVDYVQKVATREHFDNEAESSAKTVEGLKDLAMDYEVLIVGIAASERTAFEARRMRLKHLRGSAALAHECDVALVLNEKSVAVSKAHIAHDAVRAEEFRKDIVFSVEKNRGGPADMDVEFRKDFASYRFHPEGRFLMERLVDDVLVAE